MNTIIRVALVSIKTKKEFHYIWALITLQETLREDTLAEVILTNRELVMINAIHELFLTISLFFFRGYTNKITVKACKKHYPSDKALTEFYFA